ncbi:hypothetical protein ACJDU8_04505 [Clostridium sp. WILCCON 0269]|uniref:Uncharacterized protein n=1 Tax=Candidatus Clostridium eludens TaxID=3381663 RepID=A0ABW8SGJ6_9CLOT
MGNEKKHFWKDWTFFVAFFAGCIITDIVNGIIGFRYNIFEDGFNILYFLEGMLIYMICFSIIYFCIKSIKNKCVTQK